MSKKRVYELAKELGVLEGVLEAEACRLDVPAAS